MVPEGWVKTNFGTVTEIANGQVDPKVEPYLSMLHIGPENVVSNSGQIIDVTTCKESNLISGKYQFDEDAIVYSKIRPNLNKVCRPGFKGVCSADMYPIWAKRELNIEFLFHYMLGPLFYKTAVAMSMRTGMPKINRNDLNAVALLLPPLPEQNKIAQILSAWDKAITITEQLLANSQQQKKALMQQLLTGKKRLLDKNGVRFSGEWKVEKIGDIGSIKSAGVDKKTIEGEKAVRLLNFTDVFKKTYITSNDINHWVTAPDSKVSGCNVLKGDVFFTPSSETRDEVGMSSVIYEEISNCCYSYHMVRFRIKEEWDLNFKAFAFSTASFRRQVSVLADGSGQRYVVSQDGFRSVVISYPSLDEQRKIGKVLKASEDEIMTLEKKLNALKQEKKALMQQLLTGKRRVKVDDKEVA